MATSSRLTTVEEDKELLLSRVSQLVFVGSTAEFECGRCKRVLLRHYRANCGHYFCKNCKRVISQSKSNCPLPTCQRPIEDMDFQDVDFEREVYDLQTHCPNKNYGCTFVSQLKDLGEHLRRCKDTRDNALPVLIGENNVVEAVWRKFSKLSLDIKHLRNIKTEVDNKIKNIETEVDNKIKNIETEVDNKIKNIETEVDNQLKNIETEVDYKMKNFESKVDNNSAKMCEMEEMIRNAIPPKEYNVLLMGQTGVGKSTFINALANYLKFEDFNDAKTSNLEVLIPCHFTVWDSRFQKQTIRFGYDRNENMEQIGQSSTQRCKEHLLVYRNALIRIFDTPGVGDTRGLDQDKMNLEDIMGTLSIHEDLHCICILMKPNESRLTATFEFCIKQLLCHLQKNAINNIIFIFTNSRTTFYKPGDTVDSLTVILDKIKKTPPFLEIPFNENNVFCLDNEAFRFLLAYKQNIKFKPKEEEEFGQSWVTSVEVCKRLMQFIIKGNSGLGMVPHKIKETLSVNQARRVLIDLSRPLAEVAHNIQDNLTVLNQHMKTIADCKNSIAKTREQLYIPVVTLDIVELFEPRTVCQAQSCAQPFKVGTLTKCHYPQKCHDPCYLENVPREIVGHEKLRHCAAMAKETAICKKCKCPYSVHLHIYYESNPVGKKMVDEDIIEQIKNKANHKRVVENILRQLQMRAKMYREEEKKLTEYTAKLAVFLKQNAIIAYNDAFQEYLNQLIENEKALSNHGSNNQQVIKGLEKMKENYLKEKEILENALNRHDNPEIIQPEKVFEIIAKLREMKLTGGTLQLTMKAYNNVKRKPGGNNYISRKFNGMKNWWNGLHE